MELSKKSFNWPNIAEKANKLLISLHLFKMELYLKLVNTEHLDENQLSNRRNVIDILKQYRWNNVFPTRDDGPSRVRLPRFVGSNNVPCAMGYILQKTGGMNLYTDISANNNGIYVEDIRSSEYEKWLFENGMTKEETAAIQPGYPDTTRITYEIVNPVILWGVVIAVFSLIFLLSLFAIHKLGLKQPIKSISSVLVAIISFFLSYQITHFIVKDARFNTNETCEYTQYGSASGEYFPDGCEEKITPWTPSSTEFTPGYSIGIE